MAASGQGKLGTPPKRQTGHSGRINLRQGLYGAWIITPTQQKYSKIHEPGTSREDNGSLDRAGPGVPAATGMYPSPEHDLITRCLLGHFGGGRDDLIGRCPRSHGGVPRPNDDAKDEQKKSRCLKILQTCNYTFSAGTLTSPVIPPPAKIHGAVEKGPPGSPPLGQDPGGALTP